MTTELILAGIFFLLCGSYAYTWKSGGKLHERITDETGKLHKRIDHALQNEIHDLRERLARLEGREG